MFERAITDADVRAVIITHAEVVSDYPTTPRTRVASCWASFGTATARGSVV